MTIAAKNKREALRQAGYTNVYWRGNTPYGVSVGIYTSHVFAVRLERGKYYISKERV